MISTRDLSGLPDVDTLRRLMQSLAMLDAILSPEWQYRYFSFNNHWAPGEQIGSMRNGQGDHYFSLFNAAGCWLKGYDHESSMTPSAENPPKVAVGILDGVPWEFASCMAEPAFVVDETTFCIWRRYGDQQWQCGPVPLTKANPNQDGSAGLLCYLDGLPRTYQEWAEAYYGREVPLSAVEWVYARRPLHQRVVGELNPAIGPADLDAELDQIGYPAK
jgi:hypothetical protein